MELVVKVELDFDATLSITDLAQETITGYKSESSTNMLTSPFLFTYADTCTLDIIKYASTKEIKWINSYYVHHMNPGADSVRVPLPHDGHYTVDHIVLPTLEWLLALNQYHIDNPNDGALFGYKDALNQYQEGFLDNYHNGLYVINVDESEYTGEMTFALYKVSPVSDTSGNIDFENSVFLRVNFEDVEDPFFNLIAGISPLDDTSISVATYNVFSIARLKECYIKASTNVLNQLPRCGKIDDVSRFNRDFLWMIINVINIWLEKNEYDMAQVTLERIKCYNLCPDILEGSNPANGGCGCSKH